MLSALLLMAATVQPEMQRALPGVSDEETSISYATPRGIREYHRGYGDVLFMRDRRNDWYRVQVNAGCLGGQRSLQSIGVDAGIDRRLERHDRLYFGGSRICLINSIRESLAPPQVDSQSIVTLR